MTKIEMKMSKQKVGEILTRLGYYENFKLKYLNQPYSKIDYGSRLGSLEFTSFIDAADNYSYVNSIDEHIFKAWTTVLNNPDSSEEEILIATLEIFDWGKVLPGNVKNAISLYKANQLKSYIGYVKTLLISDKLIEKSDKSNKILWTSGWTKVYSFINNDIVIYDSRVSAFLNHTLTYANSYNDEQLQVLSELTHHLYNFKGALNRERLVSKSFGFRNYSPTKHGVKGFNANLIASWILQLLNEHLGLDQAIRSYERAFFMLGFDLSQLK